MLSTQTDTGHTVREVLSAQQIVQYNDAGVILLQERVPTDVMRSVRDEIDRLVLQAHGMTESNDKIDLDDSHTPETPKVRRIKSPHAQSDVIDQLTRSDWILAPVRDLIGPNLRLRTTKLNMKSAGYGAAVDWHQDWAFYPHTNQSVLAVGLMIDDLTADNGPLMVLPESHQGPVFDHHCDGVFADAVNMAQTGLNTDDAVTLTGPAGSISIHHARALHGSAPNYSTKDRRMMFFEITAADAFPLVGSDPNFDLAAFDRKMLCGQTTTVARMEAVPVRIPLPMPETVGSIYEVQKAQRDRALGI